MKRSILMVGESNVGKTHYGAQLLKRLIVGGGALYMEGAATNLTPFEKAMDSLAEGRATEHTPSTTYVESIWPIADSLGQSASLVWPDYGGEQVRSLVTERRVPGAWRERAVSATDWLLLVRLHTIRTANDMLSRPINTLGEGRVDETPHQVSDQAKLIELLQMLLHVAGINRDAPLTTPSLSVLLTCWDELGAEGTPRDILEDQLPMLFSFITSNWKNPMFMGLSALEKPLSQSDADEGYANRGPEEFGYVILPDGTCSPDITLPIQRLLADNSTA
ncbi:MULTISPECIES: hypothetical protein [Halomonadaceae]|jgi:hypothetical protein|nr:MULTISPECIES: hypothetical protein [Halomonas]|tara:strand:- start:2322 stop:3152 length:831 start_codon:yes stop_codon:yes gene_type:complete